ncbi:MAG TPA: right-handed parallel beta-helix repeat-containing protein [Terriglobales bacterium]|nr:right-handed parallel beta-helix repeat-containing protein [Terriglobales bacterium]
MFSSAALPVAANTHAVSYYVDCSYGADTNAGTSESQPWKTLAQLNRMHFLPGDSVFFRRGTICDGMLEPQGSGAPGQPISIGAYGTGPLPLIRGGENPAAIRLFNQQYWDIHNIEAVGGSPYGIFIGGSKGELHHFRIKDIVVHDVPGEPKTKESGLIVITGSGGSATIHDVVIDGATVYNTSQWAGIIIVGQQWSDSSPDPRGGSDFTVRNCIIHDVGGDGILITTLKHGLIEKNVSWNTGMQPTETIGTPDEMWAWMCDDCVVQYNEGYLSDSPGVDGGVFDIDYGNINNIIQYNYAHDSQGYCASVFGSAGPVGNSVNSEVRYNLCINNGRSPRLAKRQGAIYISTWNNGFLDGVKIHHNTIYWNPPGDFPALVSDAQGTGSRENIFDNNLIISTVPEFGGPNSFLKLDGNLYWYIGTKPPSWTYDGKTYTGWEQYHSTSGQDAHGIFADPKLTPDFRLRPTSPALRAGISSEGCAKDIFGIVPRENFCAIGAATVSSSDNAAQDSRGDSLNVPTGRWSLCSFLDISSDNDNPSRSQVVVLESMLNQYAGKGLYVCVIAENSGPTASVIENRSHDWHAENIRFVGDPTSRMAESHSVLAYPITLLFSPNGKEVSRWGGFASGIELGLKLRKLLGAPSGTAYIDQFGN